MPDFKSWLGDTPRHLNHIQAWVKSLSNDPAALCILHNFFERETVNHNILPEVFLDFFNSLGDKLAGALKPLSDLNLIRMITDERPKDFYVQGIRQPRVSIPCSRFITVDDFISYYDEGGQLPIFLGGDKTVRDVVRVVESGIVKAEMIEWNHSFKRPWWVVPTEDIDGFSGEEIRNVLGLSHCSRGAFVEMVYPDYFAQDHLVAPSVLDAGDHLCFRPVVPAPSVADDGWGRTVSFPDFNDGVREAVHEPPIKLDANWNLSVTSFINGMPSIPDYEKMLEISRGI